MQDFRKLGVWKKAHELALAVYSASVSFPRFEAFGMTGLIRRVATLIPRQIAEGSGRSNDQDFIRDLYSASSTGNDLEYLIILAKDLKYFDDAMHDKLSADVVEVKKMLMGLVRSIKG